MTTQTDTTIEEKSIIDVLITCAFSISRNTVSEKQFNLKQGQKKFDPVGKYLFQSTMKKRQQPRSFLLLYLY